MLEKIGPYELHAIETGQFRLDGGAMFGVVPQVLWKKTNPPDEKNRIQMALRSLLICGLGKKILLDAGIGTKWSPQEIERYAIDHSKFTMESSLAGIGVKPEEITDVVFTHLHFDHVGGAASFPNATYYIQEGNIHHAHAPSEKDRASFIENTIKPLQDSGRLRIVKGNVEFSPGVFAWVTEGHTPGQQLLRVTDGLKTLLACGDTIPTASHIPLPYVMAYDLYPMKTIEEKRTILESALKEDWILFFVHDPFLAACKVRCVAGKYVYSKI